MTKLRIMSNNIWWNDDNLPAWEAKGHDCSAAVRAPGFARVYRETMPDILGLQECSARMADQIMQIFEGEGLPYTLLWGRDTPILYRRDRFEVVDADFGIYPEKIDGLPGSYNNLKTKSYNIAVFREKAEGKFIIFATTHLWWMSSHPNATNYMPDSDKARAWQVCHVLDRIDALRAKYDCPAVLVGDLNASYSALAIRSALERGCTHAYDAAVEYRDETRGHHYCFGDGYDMNENPGTFAQAIDHILLVGAPEGFVRRFDRLEPDWYMPLSDHFPAWIDAEL